MASSRERDIASATERWWATIVGARSTTAPMADTAFPARSRNDGSPVSNEARNRASAAMAFPDGGGLSARSKGRFSNAEPSMGVDKNPPHRRTNQTGSPIRSIACPYQVSSPVAEKRDKKA